MLVAPHQSRAMPHKLQNKISGEFMKFRGKPRLGVSVAVLAIALPVMPALAQTTATASPQQTQPAGGLQSAPANVDEIVVTARKRTENLQNVPIVVTTASHQLLQDTGV